MNNWKSAFPKKGRFFETENGILYCIDCLEIMSEFPPNSIDTIICDPPYGVTRNKSDTPIPLPLLWQLIKKIRKDTTPIVLFGQGKFFAKLVLSNEREFRYELVWNKKLPTGFLNANRMPLRQHELIAVFYKKAGKYNPQFWEGKPLHSKGKRYKEKEITNRNYNKFNPIDDTRAGETLKYPRTILEFQKIHPSKVLHPTQKPVELMKYLVETYSNKGDIVLDFACGSGTTLIACELTHRRWIGIEINPEYCEITKQRLLELLSKNS